MVFSYGSPGKLTQYPSLGRATKARLAAAAEVEERGEKQRGKQDLLGFGFHREGTLGVLIKSVDELTCKEQPLAPK